MRSDCGKPKTVTCTGNCLSRFCLEHTRKAVAWNKIMHYATEHINFWEVSVMLLNFMWPFLSPDASDSFVVEIYVRHSPKEIPSSTIRFNIRSAHSALMYWLHEQFEVRKYAAFVPLCKILWIAIVGTRSCELRRAVAHSETTLTRKLYHILTPTVGQVFGACPHYTCVTVVEPVSDGLASYVRPK